MAWMLLGDITCNSYPLGLRRSVAINWQPSTPHSVWNVSLFNNYTGTEFVIFHTEKHSTSFAMFFSGMHSCRNAILLLFCFLPSVTFLTECCFNPHEENPLTIINVLAINSGLLCLRHAMAETAAHHCEGLPEAIQ
jgi:hypothetical protein